MIEDNSFKIHNEISSLARRVTELEDILYELSDSAERAAPLVDDRYGWQNAIINDCLNDVKRAREILAKEYK